MAISIAAVSALTLIPLSTFMVDNNGQVNSFHPVLETDVTQANLAYPTTISAVYDPDQNDWRGGWESEQHTLHSHAPGRITLDQWLADINGPDESWLHLEKGQWIEVAFDGIIIDEQGDDIFITERCCHGERAEIYLADKDDNVFLLAILNIPRTGEHGLMTYGFDLCDIILPFSPTAIRIKTTYNGFREYSGVLPGLELQQVRARVQKIQ